MASEKVTDYFIAEKLKEAKIEFTPDGSDIKEVDEALQSASKKGTGNVGHPEFTAESNGFLIVIEDKANIDKQAKYSKENHNKLDMDDDSVINYAENGALHYAQHIIENTTYKKVFAFGCSGDEKHHKIRPIFVDSEKYIPLPYVENFENFNEQNIEKYYLEQVCHETPKELLEFNLVH